MCFMDRYVVKKAHFEFCDVLFFAGYGDGEVDATVV